MAVPSGQLESPAATWLPRLTRRFTAQSLRASLAPLAARWGNVFVTFRLKDSLPQARLEELRELKLVWERKYTAVHGGKSTPQRREQLALQMMRHVESWLDKGMGSCCLRSSAASRMVQDALHAEDGTRYELGCYVVMPNHIHAVMRPLHPTSDPLEKILQSWKGFFCARLTSCEEKLALCGNGTVLIES